MTHGNTKERVIDEALKLFAEYGYTGTSMSDIASAVGIRKASLYSHYKGKESIFEAVFTSILKEHAVELERLLSGSKELEPRAGLEYIFVKYIEYCIDNLGMDFWDRFYYFPPEVFREMIHSKTHEVESLLEDSIRFVFESGIEKGIIKPQSTMDLTNAFYHMLIGFMLSLNAYVDRDIKKDIEGALNVFWNACV